MMTEKKQSWVNELAKRSTKHGSFGTKLYNVWCSMKARCNNSSSAKFKYYGGRGIRVCPEWNEFPAFKTWAEQNGYGEGLTIERIDVNGNYEPSNCAWVTMLEQSRNKRNNIPVSTIAEIKGSGHLSYREASLRHGVSISSIYKIRRQLT